MPLPSRKRHTKRASTLPKEFVQNVADLFKKQFKGKLAGATFLVYGDLHADELVLCVSLNHPKSLRAVSMHVSADMPHEAAEKPEKVTERLQSMVDVTASWFAESLAGGKGLDSVLLAMDDMDPAWQKFEWEGQLLHVKLNRDNYALENAANAFLKKSGFDPEAEDEDDQELADLLNEDEGERGPLQ